MFREYSLQRLQSKQEEQAGGASRRGGDEAAAKDGHHERSEGKRKHGCKKTVGGSRSCLRKIVRQHGPTQDGRTPCRWCERLEHMKKNDEKGKMEEMHQRKVEKMVQECRRQCSPHNHEANNVERRSADTEEVAIWKRLLDCTKPKQE